MHKAHDIELHLIKKKKLAKESAKVGKIWKLWWNQSEPHLHLRASSSKGEGQYTRSISNPSQGITREIVTSNNLQLSSKPRKEDTRPIL